MNHLNHWLALKVLYKVAFGRRRKFSNLAPNLQANDWSNRLGCTFQLRMRHIIGGETAQYGSLLAYGMSGMNLWLNTFNPIKRRWLSASTM